MAIATPEAAALAPRHRHQSRRLRDLPRPRPRRDHGLARRPAHRLALRRAPLRPRRLLRIRGQIRRHRVLRRAMPAR